jgi:hypothetical protein
VAASKNLINSYKAWGVSMFLATQGLLHLLRRACLSMVPPSPPDYR